jgi:hypothetical protein
VQFQQPTNACHGLFHGEVDYRYGVVDGQPFFGSGKQVLVGRFMVDAR